MLGNTEAALEAASVYTKQQRIAKLARQSPQMGFTSLSHYMDLDWLREAYRRTRKDGAAGVDDMTATEYERNLDERLADLLERAKSGRYVAPPVKRVYIPKDTGKETRPIGIPTLEDKILQRAVVMLLEPIYEQDFLLCSYGFRPKRSAHQALAALWRLIMNMCGCWLIDADISKFFDTLDKGHLREIVSHRVRDGVIRRLIGKWLSAGVMEEGVLWHPERGTPQGGVISPLLSNIYLHEVLDPWFEREVRPLMRGRAFLIRFADDFVMGFEMESDAHRVMEVLPKRFGRFGLTIHPEKTRLIDFRSPEQSGATPVSFDFLGFTHHWGRSRKGQPVVKRRTRKARFARGLKSLGRWCRAHRHDSLLDQSQALARKLAGHYAYYGITGNWDSLSAFRHQAIRTWHKWLQRRTNPHKLPWDKFNHILDRFPLPQPRVVHSVYA